MRPIALILALILFLAAPLFAVAQSQVIYQTFVPNAQDNSISTPEAPFASNSPYAEGWLTNMGFGIVPVSSWSATRYIPTQTFQLESITIPLVTMGGVGQAEHDRRLQNLFWFGIYSDANGAPDAALFRLTNPSVAQPGGLIPNPMAGSTFTASTPVTLAAGATYWFVMGPDWANVTTADGSTAWSWFAVRPPFADGNGSVRSTAFIPGNADWSTLTSSAQFHPGVTYSDWEGAMSIIGSPIPEPSTYAALAGLGALGLVLWRRRTPNTKFENAKS